MQSRDRATRLSRVNHTDHPSEIGFGDSVPIDPISRLELLFGDGFGNAVGKRYRGKRRGRGGERSGTRSRLSRYRCWLDHRNLVISVDQERHRPGKAASLFLVFLTGRKNFPDSPSLTSRFLVTVNSRLFFSRTRKFWIFQDLTSLLTRGREIKELLFSRSRTCRS